MAATLLSPQSDEGESIVLDVLEPLIFHLDSARLQLIKSGFLPHLTKTFNEIHNPPVDRKTFAALISLYSTFAKKKKKMCLGRDQPCLCCQPRSYIRMVQHLIERCLILRMGRDDCVQALARHAGIEPLVTLTVWNELMKANTEFFQTYTSQTSPICKPFNMESRFRKRRQWTRKLNEDDGSWKGPPRMGR